MTFLLPTHHSCAFSLDLLVILMYFMLPIMLANFNRSDRLLLSLSDNIITQIKLVLKHCRKSQKQQNAWDKMDEHGVPFSFA